MRLVGSSRYAPMITRSMRLAGPSVPGGASERFESNCVDSLSAIYFLDCGPPCNQFAQRATHDRVCLARSDMLEATPHLAVGAIHALAPSICGSHINSLKGNFKWLATYADCPYTFFLTAQDP